ncbi:MAG: hypothetical protein ACLUD0_07140 [Eubacterium ramulus]
MSPIARRLLLRTGRKEYSRCVKEHESFLSLWRCLSLHYLLLSKITNHETKGSLTIGYASAASSQSGDFEDNGTGVNEPHGYTAEMSAVCMRDTHHAPSG